MMFRRIAVFIWLIALVGFAPVYAQSAATFASGNGDDNDDCLTPATACRQISAALTKTLAGGTIQVLPGTYLGVDVTQSVNIVARGEASIIDNGAIRVSTGFGDDVRVSGFVVDGEIRGISFDGTGTLHLEDCTLLPPVARPAVEFEPTSGASQLYVTDTTISRGVGVLIRPTGSASVKAVFDLTHMEQASVAVEGSLTTGSISVALKNSSIAGSNVAVRDESGSGAATTVMIEESLITDSVDYGVVSNGTNSTVRMRNSTVRQTIVGRGRGIWAVNGGRLISHGGNVIVENQINGTFTATVPQQ